MKFTLIDPIQGNPVSVHVLQTLVLYECEKHSREEEWEEAHIGDRISGILMQLISCLQVKVITFCLISNFKIQILIEGALSRFFSQSF